MKTAVIALAFLAVASVASAQATPGSQLAWDQGASSLSEANGYTYRHFDDGATVGVTFTTPVVCTGAASPFVCATQFPAFSPIVIHTIRVSTANVAGESLPSTPLTFTFIGVPLIPSGVRIL